MRENRNGCALAAGINFRITASNLKLQIARKTQNRRVQTIQIVPGGNVNEIFGTPIVDFGQQLKNCEMDFVTERTPRDLPFLAVLDDGHAPAARRDDQPA